MNLVEFIQEAEMHSMKNLELRIGQAYWDYATNIFGEANLYHIVGTNSDPFHDDKNIGVFLIHIEELLEKSNGH